MTLDEAIKHAEEVAEEKERDRDVRKIHLDNCKNHNNIVHYEKACKCADEHRQLAEWLKDYKRLLEQQPSVDCISREDAIMCMTGEYVADMTYKPEDIISKHIQRLRALPPVTPTHTETVTEFADRCIECGNRYSRLLKKFEWLSVSEKLPKENGWYQCTVILDDLPLTMELFYKNGKWLDNRRINMFDTYDIYGYGNSKEKHKLSYQELISEFEWNQVVVAWQPLPQPYEEKRGNSDGSN